MKIRLLSDLHLEFTDYIPEVVDADVVVLAGDIHTKARGVAWALKNFPDTPVIYVPGNHEYYSGQFDRTLVKMKQAAQGTNVHVLDCEALTFGGVRFLGCTLWTDYKLTGNQALAQWDAQQALRDFKYIRDAHFKKVRPIHLLERHFKARTFLETQLAQDFAGPTVVVSHHGPTELSIHPRFQLRDNHLSASYASRLEGLLSRVALWVHGHVHDSFDYDDFGPRVVCNPRGYGKPGVADEDNADINEDFDGSLVLEV